MILYKISVLYLHLFSFSLSLGVCSFLFFFLSLCSFLIFLFCKITHCSFSYIQPSSRDNVEESEWSAVSQQGEDEELKRSSGDSQFPAGGRRRLWMCSREQDGKEHGPRTTVFPWYDYFTPSTFIFSAHGMINFSLKNNPDFAKCHSSFLQ